AESAQTAEAQGDKIAGGTCSFSPDTKVLMDHGKTKAIGKIKPGDKVQAADPKTGKHQGTRMVTATWVNHDHDLVDITIRTPDGGTATLRTTANHPFYDKSTHKWTPAAKLLPGHDLQTPNGRGLVRVKKITLTIGTAFRYNLTVEQLHTYYVLAGKVAVLVHNTCGEVPYNSGGLATKAFQHRLNTVGATLRNVAVAKVEGREGLAYGISKGDEFHAEDDILSQLNPGEKITELYTERQPCPRCAGRLADHLGGDASISWSVPWGDPETELGGLINTQSNARLKDMILRAMGI
ncbi:polymorphic toxin-type HINT domain-containing protein, partial [Streptomyces sp. TRM68367]|uniref:polymorphic toxin-type HINT domain-containing protein n=1 Tax=Streptomyces sp. TRM68367 TaxID=2758415 RepID=UPI0019BFD8DA